MALKRPSAPLKNKQNVNPSFNRVSEATAEDFREICEILESYADAIEASTGADQENVFYGFHTSLAGLKAAFPIAEENGYAIIDALDGNPQQIARFTGGDWNVDQDMAGILYFNSRPDFPNTGAADVWYIAKDTRESYLYYNGDYNSHGGEGKPGLSAYELAQIYGFEGSEEEYINSIGIQDFQSVTERGAITDKVLTLPGIKLPEGDDSGVFTTGGGVKLLSTLASKLSGNQQDSTISILDADGNILDTLPVGWLNNEATTFSFNEQDNTLDLANDAGEVLTQIPVASFLKNVANNIAKSGTKLQLRDSTNAVLSEVTLNIENIAGLAQQLADRALQADLQALNDYVVQLGITNIAGLVEALAGKVERDKLKKIEGISLIAAGPGENILLPKEMPIGKKGQGVYIEKLGSRIGVAKYPVYKAVVVDTQQELESAMLAEIDQKKIFDEFILISHSPGGPLPSPPNFPGFNSLEKEKNKVSPEDYSNNEIWKYDETLNQIICGGNYEVFTGFISPKVYDKYTLEAVISSDSIDDDFIGLVIAFYKDPQTGHEHSLTVFRSMNPSTTYRYSLIYNMGQITDRVSRTVFNADTLAASNGFTGWHGVFTKLRVVRDGDIFQIKCAQFTNGEPIIDESTLITFDLNSDPDLDVFKGSASYGFGAYSQLDSTFSEIYFSELTQHIVDARQSPYPIYQYDQESEDYFINQNLTYEDVLDVGRRAYNQVTGKIFDVTEFGILRDSGNTSQAQTIYPEDDETVPFGKRTREKFNDDGQKGVTSPGDFEDGIWLLTDDIYYFTQSEIPGQTYQVQLTGRQRYLGGDRTKTSSWKNYGATKINSLQADQNTQT